MLLDLDSKQFLANNTNGAKENFQDFNYPEVWKDKLIKEIFEELPFNQDYIDYENKVLNILDVKLEILFDSILHKTEISINRYLKSIEKTIYEEKLLTQKIESLITSLI